MATRCMILLEKTCTAYGEGNPNNGMGQAAFYRHWDGYPTATGLDLVIKVSQLDHGAFKSVHDADRALKNLLPLGDYEVESPKALHGDIEWMYVVNFDGGCTIVAHKRPRDGGSVDEWRSWPAHVLARWDYINRSGQKIGPMLEEISIRRSFED